MVSREPPVEIGPEVYARWRATTLGAVTWALEQRLILELVGDLTTKRVLDAGCGDGALVRALGTRGGEVTGLDPDPAMLAAARLGTSEAGLEARFVEGQLEQLPFADAAFDVVTAVTVLCFVPDPAGAVREMFRVLRPGGRLVVGELGRWSAWAASRRLRGWLGSPIWRRARFWTASDVRVLCERAGFSIEAVRGAVYYPPLGPIARAVAPVDPSLGRLTVVGAAFIALAATKLSSERRAAPGELAPTYSGPSGSLCWTALLPVGQPYGSLRLRAMAFRPFADGRP